MIINKLMGISQFIRRGWVLRSLLCWVIGIIAFQTDEQNQFDYRFQLRGSQKLSSQLVLITINPDEFQNIKDHSYPQLLSLDGFDVTDQFFWDKTAWKKILNHVLKYEPLKIGVLFNFNDSLQSETFLQQEKKFFQNEKVFWSTNSNTLGEISINPISLKNFDNFGLLDINRDEDGIARRILNRPKNSPTIFERLSGAAPAPSENIINYRGINSILNLYTLSEILNGSVNPELLKNKIVLIAPDVHAGSKIQTPIGVMNRAEWYFQVMDNFLEKRWISKLNYSWYFLYLGLLTLIAVSIILRYPQIITLFLFTWIGTLLASLSAWIFDSFYIWLPAFSPIVTLSATWVIFIGYQAQRIEKAHFLLQQEQQYLKELEQLKNNFVSLISHDLKTPIAKIQAVVDRLSLQSKNLEIQDDLNALRNYNEELNRYIQSILNVLRVESRELKLNIEVADINEVILEAINQVRPLALAKGICIETQLEPLFSLEFDVTLIKEVILNLIENAIKFSKSNSEIIVRSEESNEIVKITIQDHGEGISEDELKVVWNKFVRGAGQDLKTKGSGLGLYLVKYFVELHGGKVEMLSQKGQGTTVSFTLPVNDGMNDSENLN